MRALAICFAWILGEFGFVFMFSTVLLAFGEGCWIRLGYVTEATFASYFQFLGNTPSRL